MRKEKELGREEGGEREKRGLPPEKDPEEMVKNRGGKEGEGRVAEGKGRGRLQREVRGAGAE